MPPTCTAPTPTKSCWAASFEKTKPAAPRWCWPPSSASCATQTTPPSAASAAGQSTCAQAAEGSLKRLGTDHIDLYYQHRVDPQRAHRGNGRAP
ncbi:MAG: aldo/keto reductase [Hymenobacter sp.]